MFKLSVIIPCYYNEFNIPITGLALIENEKLFPPDTAFEYILVDDGSQDNTFQALKTLYATNPCKFKIIKLASNVGSHMAILAGLHYATGDCNVILAADLQDPPELIPKMYSYWLKGIKLVIANRENREDPFIQKIISNTYHTLIKQLAVKNIPKGGFDLVLFDQFIREELINMSEKNTNITYLIAWLGIDYVNIPYTRKKREVGKSKWTFTKKVKLFIDSFIAFSFFPIRIFSFIGFLTGLLGFAYFLFLLYSYLISGNIVKGWSSLMAVILLLGSTQLFGLGILGEYLWRILDEVRNRPNFIIEETLIVPENKS